MSDDECKMWICLMSAIVLTMLHTFMMTDSQIDLNLGFALTLSGIGMGVYWIMTFKFVALINEKE